MAESQTSRKPGDQGEPPFDPEGETMAAGSSQAGGQGETPQDAPSGKTGETNQTASEGSQGGKGTSQSGRKKLKRLGDFKIVRRLGRGGMGEVYLAQQISLDRKVALKTLSRDLAKNPDFVKRFVREARSMARLDHPNALRVYAVDSEQGIHYAAIEYVDGKSMHEWLSELGRISVGDAVHVALRCAEALGHAHGLKVIHRDVKPQNILLTSRGAVKLADFGLAKGLDEDVSVTKSGTGMGTPLYMSPEQGRNAKRVDGRSDIYALGVTLYQCLTGDFPFTGSSTVELLMAKEAGRFKSARQLNSEVPERLDLVIDKMLAKNPDHRYGSCEEVVRDLQSLRVESPALSFLDGSQPPPTQSPGAAAAPTGKSASATQEASGPAPPASAEGRAARASRPAAETPWYVRYTDARGKVVVGRMSTGQIRAGIKSEKLDLKAKAKKSPKDDFLPLAQFAEFESAMHNRLAKAKLKSRSSNVKDLYSRFDKEERRWRRWRWVKQKLQGAVGGLSLLLWIAVLAAIGYGLYLGVPILYEMVAEHFNLD